MCEIGGVIRYHFFENTRKPIGLGGKITVAMINLGHSPVARWGLHFLELAPDAEVLDCGCGGERPIRDTSLEKTNKKFSDLAGVKRIRIHDFRHSHASLLANEGINIQEIARRLGHSNISMTWNTYSHLYPREEERAVKILNTIV